MAQTNYRHLKQLREKTKKKRNDEKAVRKEKRPETPPLASTPDK